MFVRKKKNPNGSVTIQVIDKNSGGFKVVQNFGVVNSVEQQQSLIKQARGWISEKAGLLQLDLYNKAIEIAESIFQIEIQTPNSKTTIQKTLLLNEEQKLLAKILKF